MISLVGFDGPDAHSIIYWNLNGQDCAKTICYTHEEEQEALNRFYTAGDFYSGYEQATVVTQNGESLIFTRLNDHAAVIAM